MKPNLGKFDDPPEWKDILKFFRGNELQEFFKKMLEDKMKALIKIQYVDSVAKAKNVSQAIVGRRLRNLDQNDNIEEVIEHLELQSVLERQVG